MDKSKKLLEGIVEDVVSDRYSGPGMPDDSYFPDIFSRRFKLAKGRFRDPESGAIVNNMLPYMIGRSILGFNNIFDKEIALNSLQEDEGHSYKQTLDHEVRHYKGDNEYLARVNTGDTYSGLAA
jgi:hypothetical protein|tara:strand:+ start:3379 stop:3750 length:372 start_codon:yes stop_codon:yes gene_type:complete